VPHWRRRWFLGALMAGGLMGWLARADAASGRLQPRRRKPTGKGQALHMPPALSPFIDHLIPADALTPAASALQVPGSIWQQAQADAELQHLLRVVCEWLDRYGDGFTALQPAEREILVQWMSTAPWQSPQRRFFYWVRERAFTLYYTQPASWLGLPIERPPQPLGHVLD
jgi:hypothetical protein